jgi:sigma-B regulation protein RsbU (phosphoserine phosphatase)
MTLITNDPQESKEFLNAILDNMESVVLLLDENMRIHHVNRRFQELFRHSGESVVGICCGNALSCGHAVEENVACGKSSHCSKCGLRAAAKQALTGEIPKRSRLVRHFYLRGSPERKHLDFCCRPMNYQGRNMVLAVLHDVTELEEHRLGLLEHKERLENDLRSAALIQKSLLPQPGLRFPGLELSWRFRPSEAVGGDMFNIFRLDVRRVGLFLLDVCGHGVSAAMMAVSVSRLLSPDAGIVVDADLSVSPPERIMERLEREYPFERFASYFSAQYVILDAADGSLTYASAGHPPPVLARADGRTELLDVHGPVIGLDAGLPFPAGQARLEPGDRLFLYTDGIPERRGSDGSLFGEERLARLLATVAGQTLDQAVDVVFAQTLAFGPSAPADDICLLGVERKSQDTP